MQPQIDKKKRTSTSGSRSKSKKSANTIRPDQTVELKSKPIHIFHNQDICAKIKTENSLSVNKSKGSRKNSRSLKRPEKYLFFYEEEASRSPKIKAISFPPNVSILSIKSPKPKLLTCKVKISTKNCISSKNSLANFKSHQIFLLHKWKRTFFKSSNPSTLSLLSLYNPYSANFILCT